MRRRKLSKAVIIGVIAVIVIAVIAVILVDNAVSSALSSYHPPVPPSAISSSLSMQNAFFGNFANSTSFAAYAKLNYHETNASHVNFTLRVFKTDPIPKIYLVDTDNYCVDCFLGSTMEQELQHYLSQYGLLLNQSSFNYIQMNNLSSVAPNSIIIVPSGLIPLSFLPIQNSSLSGYSACPLNYNYSIIKMLNNGDTVFYVGYNFSKTVSCGQQIIQTPQRIINQLSSFGLGTRPANATDIKVAKEQTYLTFNSPAFLFTNGYVAPSSTYVNAFNGSIVALADYPSKGWKNASTLSRDIAALIDLHYWNYELASGSTGITAITNKSSSGGLVTLVTNTTQASLQDLINVSLSSTYVLASAYFYNSAGQLKENNALFRVSGLENGYVSTPSAVPQTVSESISAGATNITNNFDSFHIYIYNLSYEEPVQYLFIGQMKPNVTFIKPISFSLPGGYYIASLIDSNNDTYARAIFRIYNTNITTVQPFSFSNRTFTFSLHSGGYPLTGIPYSISLNGQYVQNGTVNSSIIRYSLPGGSVLSYGNETFTIKELGATETIIEPYSNAIFNIPPFYIEFAIVIVVVIVLNKILVPPNIDRYYINVQEFRHTNRAKVKEPPETILKVFDQVNYYYHWRHMPLTAEEVKSGISGNVRYGNMPIAVTLQNTYVVLNRMMRKGLVVEAADYYAPKSWEEASKHDIEYLAIFRKLRDYSVANAMLFTDIDAYDNVDMMITNKGVQNYVYIYSRLSENQKLRAIPLSKKHKTIMVFLTDEDRLAFIDRLNVSYGEMSEILRLSIESLDIRLIDTNNLDQLKL